MKKRSAVKNSAFALLKTCCGKSKASQIDRAQCEGPREWEKCKYERGLGHFGNDGIR